MNPELTTGEAVKYLAERGVTRSRKRVQEDCASGRLPGAAMVDGKWLLPRADLDAYAATMPATAERTAATLRELAREQWRQRKEVYAANWERIRAMQPQAPEPPPDPDTVMFTLDMAVEYLASHDVKLIRRNLEERCRDGRLLHATRRVCGWLVTQSDLDRLVDGWAAERRARREQMSARMKRFWLERGKPASVCRRCEIAEGVGADGLCSQCREELAGTYRWYPLESVAPAVRGVFHAWGGAE